MSRGDEHTDAIIRALQLLDAGDNRKQIVAALMTDHDVGSTTAHRWVREAESARFRRDHDLGGDTQHVRYKLTEKAFERAGVLHDKALICLNVGDEEDNDGRASNVTERGMKLARAALDHEKVLAGYYHIDKIAPDYDLSSEETRSIVTSGVAQNPAKFDTPQLLAMANALVAELATRPYLHEEQHREAKVSARVQGMLDKARDGTGASN